MGNLPIKYAETARQLAEIVVDDFQNPEHRGDNYTPEFAAGYASRKLFLHFPKDVWERWGEPLERLCYEHAIEYHTKLDSEKS